jgi:hypothetical protein
MATPCAADDGLAGVIPTIPDHPRPVILFRDVTTQMKDISGLAGAVEALASRCRGRRARRAPGAGGRAAHPPAPTGRVARWLWCAAVVLHLSGTAVPGWAGDLLARRPANALLATCEAAEAGREDGPEAATCIAFVEGFIWGHGWAAWRGDRDMYFCLPHPVSARQLLPAVLGYLRSHPDRLDQPAHLMLFAALANAYPCEPDR